MTCTGWSSSILGHSSTMLTCSHVAAPSSHTFDSKRPESELWEPEEVTNEMDQAETKWAMFVTMFEGPVENRVKKALLRVIGPIGVSLTEVLVNKTPRLHAWSTCASPCVGCHRGGRRLCALPSAQPHLQARSAQDQQAPTGTVRDRRACATCPKPRRGGRAQSSFAIFT